MFSSVSAVKEILIILVEHLQSPSSLSSSRGRMCTFIDPGMALQSRHVSAILATGANSRPHYSNK